jgi:type II secretory pathway pseudopilin PulG
MTDGNPNHEAGFTLIEALVSLVLGAMVAMLVLSTVKIGTRSLTGIQDKLAQAEALARVGAVLSQDAMHARLLRTDDGAIVFSGSESDVTFPQAARPTAAWGGVSLVRLSLRRDGSQGVTLWRAEAPYGANGTGPWSAPVPMWKAEGIGGFRFLNDRGKWLRGWPKGGIPRAFGLAIAGQGSGFDAIPRLVAAFPDLAEPDCATGDFDRCSLLPEIWPEVRP